MRDYRFKIWITLKKKKKPLFCQGCHNYVMKLYQYITKLCHELGSLNNRNLLFHSSGTESSKPRCQQIWFPLSSVRENLSHASRLAPRGLLVTLVIPWLMEASPQSLPSSSCDILPVYVCFLNSPPYVQDNLSCWIRSLSHFYMTPF